MTNHLSSVSPSLNKQGQPSSTSASTDISPVYVYGIKTLIKMMAPMAPAIGEEFWEKINNQHDNRHRGQKQTIFKGDPNSIGSRAVRLTAGLLFIIIALARFIPT